MLKNITYIAGLTALAMGLAVNGGAGAAKSVPMCFETDQGGKFLTIRNSGGGLNTRATACAGEAIFHLENAQKKQAGPWFNTVTHLRASNGKYVQAVKERISTKDGGFRNAWVLRARSAKPGNDRAFRFILRPIHDATGNDQMPVSRAAYVNIYPVSYGRSLVTSARNGNLYSKPAGALGSRANKEPGRFFHLISPIKEKTRPLAWKKLPGSAIDIGIGGRQAWAVGRDRAAYQWNGKTWQKRGGANFQRVAVDAKGVPMFVNKANEVWRYDGKRFVRRQGHVRDIAVGQNGSIWELSVSGSIRELAGKKWTPRGADGTADRLAIGPKGRAWSVGQGHQVSRRNGNRWEDYRGRAKDIAVGVDGSVWVISPDDRVYKWDGVEHNAGQISWILYEGRIGRVTVDGEGRLWGVASNGAIFADPKSLALWPTKDAQREKAQKIYAEVDRMKEKRHAFKMTIEKKKQELYKLDRKLKAMRKTRKKLTYEVERAENELQKLYER